MSSYNSDIILGGRYRDNQTGFEGVATSVTFFQYACERVAVEAYDAERREIKESIFDAPRLRSLATGETAKTPRSGGPGRPNHQRQPLSR